MNIVDVEVFLNTVLAGSLSGGARLLKISHMVATRRLAALEAELGVRLLHRTTRASSLTAEGEAFFPYASRLVEEAAAGKAVVASSGSRVEGRLRITCCHAVARTVVVPAVTRMLKENPDLEIDLVVDDEIVDVVSNAIDVAVRIGELRESSLIGTAIGTHPRALYAAPVYFANKARPECLDDLMHHECLLLSGQRHWHFTSAAEERTQAVAGRFTATSIESIHDACLNAAGIAMLSSRRAASDVAAGRLLEISLRDFRPREHAVHAVIPPGRQLLPKVKRLVQILRTTFREADSLATALQPGEQRRQRA